MKNKNPIAKNINKINRPKVIPNKKKQTPWRERKDWIVGDLWHDLWLEIEDKKKESEVPE